MRLSEWRQSHKISMHEAARRLSAILGRRMTAETWRRYELPETDPSVRLPRRAEMRAIARLTGALVTANDFSGTHSPPAASTTAEAGGSSGGGLASHVPVPANGGGARATGARPRPLPAAATKTKERERRSRGATAGWAKRKARES